MSTNGDDRPLRIMLVEDDVESSQAMRVMLERRGATVRALASGEAAMAEWSPESCDAVVADIRMDNMTGVDVLRAVRAVDADFPVILLTAYDSLSTAIEAVRLGAQDYILKPLDDVEGILKPVRQAVARHRLLIENRGLQFHLRALAGKLGVLEEEERRKTAAALHDTLAQDLAVMKIALDAALRASDVAAARPLIADALRTAEQVIRQVRELVLELSPPILRHLGPLAAIDSLVGQLRKRHGGVDIHLSAPDANLRFGPDVEIALFRSVRELLVNALKHARPTRVDVLVEAGDGECGIIVSDNGVGFDVAAATAYRSDAFGYGLFSVREQLRNVGGDLLLRSAPGAGTEAQVRISASGGTREATHGNDNIGDGR